MTKTVQRLRWGVLGTASIARRRLIPALQGAEQCELVAIASRNASRAEATAAHHDVPSAIEGYEALLRDDRIDIVYIALPNVMHVDWAHRALLAGKHVLCEKPLGCPGQDLSVLAATARNTTGRRLEEAVMIRHHPQWHAVQTLIANGDLGQLQAIDIQFSFYEAEPTNIRNQKHLGGGSLLDIGCYAVHVGQMLLGRPPISVDGAAQWDSPGGVDTHGTLFLDYGDTHLTARFGHRSAYAQEVTIYGSSRHARLPYPFTMPIDRSCQIILTRNSRSGWSEYETLTFPAMDQYKAMVSEVSRRILEDEEQVVPLADSIAVNSVLEAAVRRFEQCTR